MSWEANAWAMRQRMKLPQEQLVLIVLGNCADPDGVAFAKWPGRDHWWHYLSRVTRLSRSSIFRHLNTIVALGLASREMMVLANGSKRPTVRLDLAADFDIESEEVRYLDATATRQGQESHHETDEENGALEAENANNNNSLVEESRAEDNESHHETAQSASPTSGTDAVPLVRLHIDSIEDSNLSPYPLSEGDAVDPLWNEFVRSWGEPIQRLALTRSAWDRVPTDKRAMLVAAAKGFWAYRRSQSRPPAAQSAQSFVRDEIGWTQWLPYVPDASGTTPSIATVYPHGSPEAKAIGVLYDIAGKSDFFRSVLAHGRGVYYSRPMTPRLLALARATPKDTWFTVDIRGAGSWEDLLRDALGVLTRRPLRAGNRAPWPFAPSKEGKLYTGSTGPPETLMRDEDYAELK